MKEAASSGGPFSYGPFTYCRFNVIALGACEGVQLVAGFFQLDAKEPRERSAFGTVGPFNGIGMWRARLVGGHRDPYFFVSFLCFTAFSAASIPAAISRQSSRSLIKRSRITELVEARAIRLHSAALS